MKLRAVIPFDSNFRRFRFKWIWAFSPWCIHLYWGNLDIYDLFSFRQGLRLCWRLHCKHHCSGGCDAFLRGWFHLYHLAASDAPSWSETVDPGSQERRGPQLKTQSSAKCQAAPTNVDGFRSACGSLPQPHHPSSGNHLFCHWIANLLALVEIRTCVN